MPEKGPIHRIKCFTIINKSTIHMFMDRMLQFNNYRIYLGISRKTTLCKYDLRKGDLFILSWASVRRVRRGNISSALLMCAGGVRSIFLLPLVARCLETIDVCIWHMFVFMAAVVTVWGSVGMLVCSGRC